MLLKHLINPKPQIILSCIILFIIVCGVTLCASEELLLNRDKIFVFTISFILKIFLCVYVSLKLSNVIYTKNIIRKDNIIVGAVFVFLASAYIDKLFLLLSSFLMLLLINELINSYQKENPFSQYFNASFIISLLTFFYPNLFLLIFLLIINSINYSNFNWRILIIILLGFLTPYSFYLIYSVLTEQSFLVPNFFNYSLTNVGIYLPKNIYAIVLIIILLMSLVELFNWLYKKSIKSRKTFMNIIWMLIITSLIGFLSDLFYFYFTIIPVTIIMSNYFIYSKKRKIANILFLIFIISSLFYNTLITL